MRKKAMKMGFDACYKITRNWEWYYVFNYFLYRMQDSKTFWCTEISNLNLSGKTFSLVAWHDINLNVFYSRNQINYLKIVFHAKASLNCCVFTIMPIQYYILRNTKIRIWIQDNFQLPIKESALLHFIRKMRLNPINTQANVSQIP